MNCNVCGKEAASCWCPCPLCGKSSTAEPGSPEACGCAYEDLTVALRASTVYAELIATKAEAALEACRALDCSCTLHQRLSGHVVGCYVPQQHEALDALRDALTNNAALRIAPGSAGDGVPLKVPQGANGQAISDSREESGTGSNPEAAPICHETNSSPDALYDRIQNLLMGVPMPDEGPSPGYTDGKDAWIADAVELLRAARPKLPPPGAELRHQSGRNVPAEPTQQMIEAACKAADEDGYQCTRGYFNADDAARTYRAMLAAAPGECVHQVRRNAEEPLRSALERIVAITTECIRTRYGAENGLAGEVQMIASAALANNQCVLPIEPQRAGSSAGVEAATPDTKAGSQSGQGAPYVTWSCPANARGCWHKIACRRQGWCHVAGSIERIEFVHVAGKKPDALAALRDLYQAVLGIAPYPGALDEAMDAASKELSRHAINR